MPHLEQFDRMARRHGLNAYAVAKLMREFIDQQDLGLEFAVFAAKMLVDSKHVDTDDGI